MYNNLSMHILGFYELFDPVCQLRTLNLEISLKFLVGPIGPFYKVQSFNNSKFEDSS